MKRAGKAKTFLGYRVVWLLMSTRERYTIHEVANEVGCNPHCAYRHLRELWSLEFIRIGAWDRSGNTLMPVYEWGDGPDARRPVTRDEKRERARKSRVTDPIKRELKRVYMEHYSRGTTWREAMREDVASG